MEGVSDSKESTSQTGVISQNEVQMASILENVSKQLAETSAQNKELREKLLVEDKKTSKNGIFSRLFGK